MGAQSTVIHTNPALKHQVEAASRLQAGFRRHGIDAAISGDPNAPADLHVVMGPWFALKQQKHATTLYLDRAYWGDPGCVSLHWLKHGEKEYQKTTVPRAHPDLQPLRTGNRSIYLCDYGEAPPEGVPHRRHPADQAPDCSLREALAPYQVATGGRTTALVTAAIAGLRVYTDDSFSPVAGLIRGRAQWIIGLAWHNWSLDEIEQGDMWEHLQR